MTYFGGKGGAGVAQQIINRMPPHTVYIEPFAGGAAVMWVKRPAQLNIALDRDQEALASLETAVLAITVDPLAGNGDVSGRIVESSDAHRRLPVETARAAGIARSGEGARLSLQAASPFSAMADHPKYQFLHQDALPYLTAYPFNGSELVYCDPPYMLETRGDHRYKFDFTNGQHHQLLSILLALPCRVMISGYWTALYSRKLAGWHTFNFQTTNRAGQRTTEWVWMNFPEPVELHDYRFLGRDFRERERIKRKKQRWVAKLKCMPVLERRALLAAIAEAPSTIAEDGEVRSPDIASPGMTVLKGATR